MKFVTIALTFLVLAALGTRNEAEKERLLRTNRALLNALQEIQVGGMCWHLLRNDALCYHKGEGGYVVKNLAVGSAIENCQNAALADRECSNTMYGNGKGTCVCVQSGKKCNIVISKKSREDKIYKYAPCSDADIYKLLGDDSAVGYNQMVDDMWCADQDGRMNVCDGNLERCYLKGLELCDQQGDSCFGVMVHRGWTAGNRGFVLCKSKKLAPKHDGWLTKMKNFSGEDPNYLEEHKQWYHNWRLQGVWKDGPDSMEE